MNEYVDDQIEYAAAVMTLTRGDVLKLIGMLASYGDDDRSLMVRVMDDGSGSQFASVTIGGGLGCTLPLEWVRVEVRETTSETVTG